jgi:hypothetical protein
MNKALRIGIGVKAHNGDPFWCVTLYYFLMYITFECISLQSFERFSQCYTNVYYKYTHGSFNIDNEIYYYF